MQKNTQKRQTDEIFAKWRHDKFGVGLGNQQSAEQQLKQDIK